MPSMLGGAWSASVWTSGGRLRPRREVVREQRGVAQHGLHVGVAEDRDERDRQPHVLEHRELAPPALVERVGIAAHGRIEGLKEEGLVHARLRGVPGDVTDAASGERNRPPGSPPDPISSLSNRAPLVRHLGGGADPIHPLEETTP